MTGNGIDKAARYRDFFDPQLRFAETGIEAYRRLLPEDYVRTRAAMEGASRFQGMAWWGQFLDRNGNVKQPLQEALLVNLDRLNANRLWEAFPLPAFRVSAPIDVFYDAYGI